MSSCPVSIGFNMGRQLDENKFLFLGDRLYKSSAVAKMGDRGNNRHGPKRGGWGAVPFRGALGTRLIQCGLRRCLLPY